MTEKDVKTQKSDKAMKEKSISIKEAKKLIDFKEKIGSDFYIYLLLIDTVDLEKFKLIIYANKSAFMKFLALQKYRNIEPEEIIEEIENGYEVAALSSFTSKMSRRQMVDIISSTKNCERYNIPWSSIDRVSFIEETTEEIK